MLYKVVRWLIYLGADFWEFVLEDPAISAARCHQASMREREIEKERERQQEREERERVYTHTNTHKRTHTHTRIRRGGVSYQQWRGCNGFIRRPSPQPALSTRLLYRCGWFACVCVRARARNTHTHTHTCVCVYIYTHVYIHIIF